MGPSPAPGCDEPTSYCSSTLSCGVDYIFFLPSDGSGIRIVSDRDPHYLEVLLGKSRRVIPPLWRDLPFRVSRYGVNLPAGDDFPRCCRACFRQTDGFTVISRLMVCIPVNLILFRRKVGKNITVHAPRYVKVPNRVVDVDSWTRSACYPRSNFYPLSFDHPILDRRITNFCFRNCSGCRPCSKAGLWVCPITPVSIGS